MPTDLLPIETHAIELPARVAVPVSAEELDRLLSNPAYHSSVGHPGHASHYRRGLPDGTGLHLVIADGRGELHRDDFNPHASPAAMLLHLATDSPAQVLSLIAAGWAAFGRLGAQAPRVPSAQSAPESKASHTSDVR